MTDLELVIRRSHRAHSTKQSYVSAVRNFLRSLPEPSTKYWTRAYVQMWVDGLVERGVRHPSIQQYLTGLRYAAHKLGLDFADGVEAPGDARVETLADGDVKAIFSWRPSLFDDHGFRDRALVALCLGAGWSQSSILQGTIADAHAASLAPCIRALVDPWTTRFYATDPLAPPLTRRIRGTDVGADPVTSYTLTKALRRRAGDLGWRTIRIRDLRATFRRLAAEAGLTSTQIADYIATRQTPQELLQQLEHRLRPLVPET